MKLLHQLLFWIGLQVLHVILVRHSCFEYHQARHYNDQLSGSILSFQIYALGLASRALTGDFQIPEPGFGF